MREAIFFPTPHIAIRAAVSGLAAIANFGFARAAGVATVMAIASIASAGTLDTPDNLAQETLLLRLLASEPMREATKRTEKIYRDDAQSRTEGGSASLRRAVDAIAAAAVQYAISDDGQRPKLMWVSNAPHRWHGLSLPRSGYGIDNRDNVYRQVAVDGTSSYRIHARVRKPGPAQQTLIVYGAIPGTTAINNEGAAVVGVLRSDQIAYENDGSYRVTLGPEPAAGRPNHIQTKPEAKLLIFRDSFSDWTTQNVTDVEIHRTAGPAPKPAPDEKALALRAAEILDEIGPYWVAYDNQFVYGIPANQPKPPRARPGAFGFSSGGHYALAPDEALVVTLDPMGAGYLGFQTTDAWGVAWEYAERSSSLNNRQATPNADGTYTYVIARRDPGAVNWLDVEGSANGMFAIRWQAIAQDAATERAVKSTQVLKLDALKSALAAGTKFLSPTERVEWQRARIADYQRRIEQK